MAERAPSLGSLAAPGAANANAAVAPLSEAQRSPGYWQSVLVRMLGDKVAMGAGDRKSTRLNSSHG